MGIETNEIEYAVLYADNIPVVKFPVGGITAIDLSEAVDDVSYESMQLLLNDAMSFELTIKRPPWYRRLLWWLFPNKRPIDMFEGG